MYVYQFDIYVLLTVRLTTALTNRNANNTLRHTNNRKIDASGEFVIQSHYVVLVLVNGHFQCNNCYMTPLLHHSEIHLLQISFWKRSASEELIELFFPC